MDTCQLESTVYQIQLFIVLVQEKLGWGNPHYQYRLGDKGSESSPAERDLGVTGGRKAEHELTMCACSPEGQLYPGLRQRQVEGGDSASLLRSGETPPGVLCPALEP